MIEELVREAREFISAFAAQQDEGYMLTYLLIIVFVAAVAYACFF